MKPVDVSSASGRIGRPGSAEGCGRKGSFGRPRESRQAAPFHGATPLWGRRGSSLWHALARIRSNLTSSRLRHSLNIMDDLAATLREHGIQPTLPRLAVAGCVLGSEAHPTADDVLTLVRRRHPTISRATVYNTLNLFVEKHLLRTQILREGTIVFDPNTGAHHHFVDEESGKVYDVPWNAIRVTGHQSLDDFEIREFQVVMRGRRKGKK
jgi:Fur family transcriptional regulator, iron response regulator